MTAELQAVCANLIQHRMSAVLQKQPSCLSLHACTVSASLTYGSRKLVSSRFLPAKGRFSTTLACFGGKVLGSVKVLETIWSVTDAF